MAFRLARRPEPHQAGVTEVITQQMSLSATADVSDASRIKPYTPTAWDRDRRDMETGNISYSHKKRNVTATWMRLSRDEAAHYIQYRGRGGKVCRLGGGGGLTKLL